MSILQLGVMGSKQIYKILKNDTNVRKLNFLGVFPIDLIPLSAMKFSCCLVINTKPHDHPGEHWNCLVKCEDRRAIYFDSFGIPPFNLPEVGDILSNCDKWTFNETH